MFNFPSVPQQKWLPIAPGVCSLCVCVYALEWLIEADQRWKEYKNILLK